jgi:hypothetical protein
MRKRMRMRSRIEYVRKMCAYAEAYAVVHAVAHTRDERERKREERERARVREKERKSDTHTHIHIILGWRCRRSMWLHTLVAEGLIH